MKKVIATILVAFMVIGCVFAATEGTATIKLNVTIARLEPTFRLDALASDGVVTGTVAKVTETKEVEINSAKASALADNSSEVATVGFVINQISDAKMFGGYDLTVAATDLVAKKPADVSDSDWALIDSANKTFTCTTKTPTVTAHAKYETNSLGFATLSATTNKLNVTYIGILKANETTPTELGTFSASWSGNDKAISADYEATVTLTVATH